MVKNLRLCGLIDLDYLDFISISPHSPVCIKSLQSYLTLCDPMDYIAHQAPLSMGFPRQEYWSGLPFPSSMHESEKFEL